MVPTDSSPILILKNTLSVTAGNELLPAAALDARNSTKELKMIVFIVSAREYFPSSPHHPQDTPHSLDWIRDSQLINVGLKEFLVNS
mmetsp:Transcript_2550/g.4465  ORF Transcript_2550/g.4465 Transcript_2550/m.4465 type:complete len:87 (+) Transcript_2550:1005-1265(+)